MWIILPILQEGMPGFTGRNRVWLQYCYCNQRTQIAKTWSKRDKRLFSESQICQEIADAIIEMAGHRPMKEKYGEAGRQNVVEHYSAQAVRRIMTWY